MICSYAETMFYAAEAYVRGLGVAKDLAQADAAYRKGIEASCVYNGVAAATAASFAAGVPSLSTLGGDDKALEAIASQQRIEMMMRPLEAWSNQRRTGYPALEVPALDPQLLPRRHAPLRPAPNARAASTTTFPHVDGVWTKMWFERTDGGDRRHARQEMRFPAACFFYAYPQSSPPPDPASSGANRVGPTAPPANAGGEGPRTSVFTVVRQKDPHFFFPFSPKNTIFAPDIHKGVPYFPG